MGISKTIGSQQSLPMRSQRNGHSFSAMTMLNLESRALAAAMPDLKTTTFGDYPVILHLDRANGNDILLRAWPAP